MRSKLSTEFQSLGKYLEANGPFLKGENISAGDLALGPKLYHVFTASKEFKVPILLLRRFSRLVTASTQMIPSNSVEWLRCI